MSFLHLSVCLSECPSPPSRSHCLSLSLVLSLSLIVSLSLSVSLPPPVSLSLYLSHCISLPPLSLVALSRCISLSVAISLPLTLARISLVVSLSRSHCISLSVSLSLPRSLFVSLSPSLHSRSLSLPPLSLVLCIAICLSLVTPEHTFLSPSTVYALSACYFESQVPPPGVAHIVFTAEGLRDGYKLSSISH